MEVDWLVETLVDVGIEVDELVDWDVGTLVGTLVGTDADVLVGTDVGALVVKLLEVDVSSLVGLVEGAVDEEDGISLVGWDGSLVGIEVGWLVGSLVGTLVGSLVGIEVDSLVGVIVDSDVVVDSLVTKVCWVVELEISLVDNDSLVWSLDELSIVVGYGKKLKQDERVIKLTTDITNRNLAFFILWYILLLKFF